MFCGHEDKGSVVLNGLGYISEESDGVLDELNSDRIITCVEDTESIVGITDAVDITNITDITKTNSDCADIDNTENDIEFKVILSAKEKIFCLKEIIKKLKKILYVYDKSLEPNSTYDYKIYCGGVMIYVSSSNLLFDGELVNIVINLNAIMTNEFTKPQIKRVVFECVNYAQYLLSGIEKCNKNEKINKRKINNASI